MAPIPKITDPALKDLRPLMLYEVLRKIWIGTIMEKKEKQQRGEEKNGKLSSVEETRMRRGKTNWMKGWRC